MAIVIDGHLSVRAGHRIAVETEHALLHAVPKLTAAVVHTDIELAARERDPHRLLSHHAAA